MSAGTLGILGGLGPMATVCFMDMIVRMTDAASDQEHIPMVVLNDTAIPDRTAFILDPTKPDPLPRMQLDAARLEGAGADLIVMPCNTAHYFYEKLQLGVHVPRLNIIAETVDHAIETVPGLSRLGILATRGTLAGEGYQRTCDARGIGWRIPDETDQAALMRIIYDQVKAGKPADLRMLNRVVTHLHQNGCDAVVLGCTELSVINRDYGLTRERDDLIDSMEVLAKRSILACGRKLRA